MNEKLELMFILFIMLLVGLNAIVASPENITHKTDDGGIEIHEGSTKSTEKPLKAGQEDDKVINITRENYGDYFNSFGEINCTNLENNSRVQFYSIPDGVSELVFLAEESGVENMSLAFTGMDNFTLNDTTVVVFSKAKNMRISNIALNYGEQYRQTYFMHVETVGSGSCVLENLNISCTHNARNSYSFYGGNNVYPLSIMGDNVLLESINVCANIPSSTIPYSGGDDKPHGIALNLEGNNMTVANSVIQVAEKDKENLQTAYNTIYGVFHEGRQFTFINNTVNITGTEYVYALVARSSECNITYNNVTAESIAYAAGINVEGVKIENNLVSYNNIEVTAGYRPKDTTPTSAEDSAYALMLLDYSYKGYKYSPTSQSINNTTFTDNNITGSAGNIYAIEVYGGTNTKLENNSIDITGRTPMGIGVIGENITIRQNDITAKGETNRTEGSADYLKPRTTGIYTYMSSVGIQVERNTIKTTKGRGIYIEQTNNTMIRSNRINTTEHDYTIEVTGMNNTIAYNRLISRSDINTTIRTTRENTVEYNTDASIKDAVNITVESINITAQYAIITVAITGSHGEPISIGQVYFKVNGKILRDDTTGKILYADVEDSKATIRFTTVKSWNNKTSIQAVYIENEDYNASVSKVVQPTTHTTEEFTLNDVTTFAGGQVTITVTTKNLNAGKVVLKVNGKTVKTDDGKLYAKVEGDSLVFTYTVPKTLKAGEYSIKAVYTSGTTKLEAESTLMVG